MGWKDDTVYLAVWVDDMLIAASKSETIDMIKGKLKSAFDIHDLGEAKRFLGMDIVRDRAQGTLHLSQSRAIIELADKFNMSECKGRNIPISVGTVLTAIGEPLDVSRFPYSTLVGSMMYLSVCTRPDIAFAVGALSRFMSAPTIDHWRIAKGVLRYLSNTIDTCLTFTKAKAGFKAFCDSDFAGNIDSRKSTTGFVFTLNGGAISWRSKLQATVACSTVEAEYIAASTAVKEALWLRLLLNDLGMSIVTVNIFSDNQGAIKIAKDPIASVRSKHIDVAYHFIRERIARKDVSLSYISTDDMAADMFTKPVPVAKFSKCKHLIGLT